MGLVLGLGIVAVLGLMAFVRLAPVAREDWHIGGWPVEAGAPFDEVVRDMGSATLRLSQGKGAPADLLARLDRVAMATPRTMRLAGSVEEGRITWETRSLIRGFPDYTTAEVRGDGLYVLARLRFGAADLGVNAARLTDWLDRL